MSKKTTALISTIIFFGVTVIELIHSSVIDAGSWINPDPLAGGHYMSVGESILHNLFPSVIDGLILAGIFIFSTFLARKLYFYCTTDLEK